MYKPKYFSFAEFVNSSTANNRRINNTPTFTAIQNILQLCETVLDPARIEYGSPIRITSGFRSLTLNKAVGGVANSQHLSGCAADLVCSDMNRLFDILAKNPNIDQLLFEHNKRGSRWIHVSISPTGKPRHHINKNYKA